MLDTQNEEKNTEFYSYFALFYEYSNLEHVHIRVVYRVNQAEYEIRILVAASQKYVNTYSTRRLPGSPDICRYTCRVRVRVRG